MEYGNNVVLRQEPYNINDITNPYTDESTALKEIQNRGFMQSDFISFQDDYYIFEVDGKTKRISEDCYISCNNIVLEENNLLISENMENKSVNDSYKSEAWHVIKWQDGTDKRSLGKEFSINNVRVHTPIHNEIAIDTLGQNNQFNNENIINNDIKINGETILNLGEKFVINIQLNGESYYYANRKTDIEKYVKKIEIDCPFCNITSINVGSHMHKCTVPVNIEDKKLYKIKVRVIAENNSNTNVQTDITNTPDDYYILEQTATVYVVGKIYDLEVRTVDDPVWKLRQAEKLAKLPIGESNENAITSYKNGIKLGYRAYFDLKTLGQINQSIKIIPKIYYVTKDGVINENITLYYKTSKKEYKKLVDNDISIIMKITATKGEENNSEFKRELILTKIAEKYKDINLQNNINIGGLSEINLARPNSVITKYNGVEYIGEWCDVSRRWLGEIYMPASTIVVDNNVIPTNTDLNKVISKIEQGKGVLKEGYLMITFDNIISLDEGGEEYLNYEILRNENGEIISPNAPSVLVQEKETKNKITLPNGKEIINLPSNFKETNAQIIIYDVSLRANDDYESTGTH